MSGPTEVAILSQLLAHRERVGSLPGYLVEAACRELGWSRAKLYRRLTQSAAGGRARRRLTDNEIAAFYDAQGNAAVAWRRLRDERGESELPSLRDFQRLIGEQLTEQERTYARRGPQGARAVRLFMERRERGRGLCHEADHKQADVYVRVPRGSKLIRPWITIFMDTFSRAIAGLAISLWPTQAEVLAAMGSAFRPWSTFGPSHGLPHMIRIDRGLEFTADAVTAACTWLDIEVVHTPPYRPNRKGKVERLHRTIVDEFLSTLPHYLKGPRRASGELIVPSGVKALTLEAFVSALLDYCEHYNQERPHAGLEGRTPAEAWDADATPIRKAEEADLQRFLLKEDHPKKVSTRGIYREGRWYTAAVLEPLIGKTVEVRFVPHDPRQVWIYRDAKLVCRARSHRELTPEEREAILRGNEAAARVAAVHARRAKKRARRRYASIVRRGQVDEIPPPGEPAEPATRTERRTIDSLGLSTRRGRRRE
jgi:putative transposase